jgi:hypothetical protein
MKLKVITVSLIVILLVLAIAAPLPTVSAVGTVQSTPPEQSGETSVEVVNDYYSIIHTTTRDGTSLQADVINGPPAPPDRAAWEASRSTVSALDRAAHSVTTFPSYSWVFGCSAVSGAMIAGYYDNMGYSDMYTGPTNGGVMPQTDTSWGTWNDGYEIYPNNPLIASHDGVDGRSGRGSIDDYWVSYFSEADDPYVGSWTQHIWGTAIGDYMKTSQSAYNNVDGSTSFYYYSAPGTSTPLTCDAMASGGISQYDGTYGRKLFYEAQGYSVTDCYNQPTSNQVAGGFSLINYQAEIDAGHPVFINLAGHSVVGYGYNNSTIYIRDTWDSDPGSLHTMTWGGSYQGMVMQSVSIVHLEAIAPPGELGKTGPADGAINQFPNLTLSWEKSFDVSEYEYCIDDSDDGVCNNWVSTGLDSSIQLSGLDFNTTYYWQVRAVNELGATDADDGDPDDWQFTTLDLASLTEKNFVPLILN